MAREKLSRNTPCPCGSGKKYKVCCLKKGIEYAEDASGTIHQSVPMTGEVAEVFRVQREKFVERFGREPGPDDPVFFDMPHPLPRFWSNVVSRIENVLRDKVIIDRFPHRRPPEKLHRFYPLLGLATPLQEALVAFQSMDP